MVSKTLIVIIVFGLIASALAVNAFFAFYNYKSVMPVSCSQEAKLCPDGTYVGRQGPNCEFAKCPDEVTTPAVIKGKVSVGPICPIEQAGVPCPVPPEAYTSREVLLYAADGTTLVKSMHFLADGTYSFEIPAGTYVLSIPRQQVGGTADLPKTFNLKSGTTTEFNFSIDTGIR